MIIRFFNKLIFELRKKFIPFYLFSIDYNTFINRIIFINIEIRKINKNIRRFIKINSLTIYFAYKIFIFLIGITFILLKNK